jgi:AcrR family transcriptional regulator
MLMGGSLSLQQQHQEEGNVKFKTSNFNSGRFCRTILAMSRTAAKEKIRDARLALYREHILDAAEQVFAEHGYEAAKVVSMAAAAGVSLATVYASFETKWEIYRAVHARRTEALDAFVRERGAVLGGPLERMLAGISAHVEFHMQNPNYLRMHLREGNAWSASSTLHSPEQLAAWGAGFKMMVKAFESGIRKSLYVTDERPELMARTMIAMHQVRLADWVDRGMKESVPEVTASIYRQFVRTFCTPTVARDWLKRHAASLPGAAR